MSTFLILDQDPIISADICSFFSNIGHSMYKAADFAGALQLLQKRTYDVIISSASIAGGTLHELIAAVKPRAPDTAIIFIADLPTINEAVRAVSEGAFSIVQKPFSIPELNFQIKRALDKRSQRVPSPQPEWVRRDVYQPYNFIGESPQIKKVFKIVAPTPA
jgi:two-component system, NtrC family, response regulator PilR